MRRGVRLLDAILALALVAGLVGTNVLLRPEDVAGRPRVVDGDTLAMDGRRIRLKGLDAPELAQHCERNGTAWPCGEAAREALRVLVSAGPVTCSLSGHDRYRRDLAACAVDGADLGSRLVRSGMAVAEGGYGREEGEAREARAGIWAGPFERPSAWRRRQADARGP